MLEHRVISPRTRKNITNKEYAEEMADKLVEFLEKNKNDKLKNIFKAMQSFKSELDKLHIEAEKLISKDNSISLPENFSEVLSNYESILHEYARIDVDNDIQRVVSKCNELFIKYEEKISAAVKPFGESIEMLLVAINELKSTYDTAIKRYADIIQRFSPIVFQLRSKIKSYIEAVGAFRAIKLESVEARFEEKAQELAGIYVQLTKLDKNDLDNINLYLGALNELLNHSQQLFLEKSKSKYDSLVKKYIADDSGAKEAQATIHAKYELLFDQKKKLLKDYDAKLVDFQKKNQELIKIRIKFKSVSLPATPVSERVEVLRTPELVTKADVLTTAESERVTLVNTPEFSNDDGESLDDIAQEFTVHPVVVEEVSGPEEAIFTDQIIDIREFEKYLVAVHSHVIGKIYAKFPQYLENSADEHSLYGIILNSLRERFYQLQREHVSAVSLAEEQEILCLNLVSKIQKDFAFEVKLKKHTKDIYSKSDSSFQRMRYISALCDIVDQLKQNFAPYLQLRQTKWAIHNIIEHKLNKYIMRLTRARTPLVMDELSDLYSRYSYEITEIINEQRTLNDRNLVSIDKHLKSLQRIRNLAIVNLDPSLRPHMRQLVLTKINEYIEKQEQIAQLQKTQICSWYYLEKLKLPSEKNLEKSLAQISKDEIHSLKTAPVTNNKTIWQRYKKTIIGVSTVIGLLTFTGGVATAGFIGFTSGGPLGALIGAGIVFTAYAAVTAVCGAIGLIAKAMTKPKPKLVITPNHKRQFASSSKSVPAKLSANYATPSCKGSSQVTVPDFTSKLKAAYQSPLHTGAAAFCYDDTVRPDHVRCAEKDLSINDLFYPPSMPPN